MSKLSKAYRNPVRFFADSKVLPKWLPQIGLVWLPMLLAVVYFALLASPRYVSEARFVLLKSSMEVPARLDLGALVSGATSSHQDSLQVKEHILSLDMLQVLDKRLELRKHFSDPAWDPISRLSADASQEDFLSYYRDHVKVEFDEMSVILTVNVDTFNPVLSQRLVETILQRGEKFVNAMGQRIAVEQMGFVAQETERCQAQLREAKHRLIAFQNDHQLISPRGETESLVGVIGEMEAELIRQRAELKNLMSYLNPDASQVISKRNQLAALEEQISQEKARIVGEQDDGDKLNELAASFEDIQMDLEFATDMYKASLAAMETARVEAVRKLMHLVVVDSPSMPEEALYPRRLYSVITIFIFLLLSYGIVRLLHATIKDHRD